MRALVSIIAGYGIWTIAWLAGNAGLAAAFPQEQELFEAGEALTDPAYLGAALVLSVVCSICAGLLQRMVSAGRSRGALWIMALALLGTGIAVQLGVWERMPLWYHSVFLALIVPVCILSGRSRM